MNLNYILTPCILQTVIICISSLIALYCIASIIKSLWGKKDNREICPLEKKSNCETCHEKKHLLYKLIVVFLVFLLVILFSHKFYAYDNVFNFMSFASAIISIILAVLTIIYTYFTQGTTSSAAEKIEKASSEMKQVVKSISNARQTYDDSAETLNDNVKDILRRIKGISHKVGADTDYENVGELKNVDAGTSNEVDEFKEEVLTEFNKGNSNAGVIILYLCSKVKETEKECVLSDIFTDDTIMYFAGYIIALNVIGFTAIEIDIATKTIKSADIVDDLIEGAERRLSGALKNKFIKEYKQKIDDYFSKTEEEKTDRED